MVENNAETVPGVSVQLTGAHTRGHQIVLIDSGGKRAICVSDLCPTTDHLRTFWTMGYDQFLRDVRRTKPMWLGRAADEGWLVIFHHDPQIRAAYLRRDPEEEFVLREIVPL